jgi:predicted glycoside hydrolase/deacetylase ChbG (UPF0249 family)
VKGTSSSSRRLIVNADDLGQSGSVNSGIMHAVDHGIVTSASLMVRWPAAVEGAAMAADRPTLSIGLHLDLGEWGARNGEWSELYRVSDHTDERALAEELDCQLDRFSELVGRSPTHLDSHQHAHREEPLRSLMVEAAAKLGVHLRGESSSVQYCGSFYGQYGAGYPYPEGITVDALEAVIESLPAGTTELGCHPGLGPFDDLNSTYLIEREDECRSLCDPRSRAILSDNFIQLCSYLDV